ncbi:serine/threonine-protein kinase [Catelliglobosispora koreensis]|uniref:serine/threonine-protein kinase n=1 Tax=Catelliglobosispora koreensis TaxID=129052 RepID=UPI000382CB1D|nr:serine/threonine-protein kinase [Catelliglobosispora koreensis]
MFPQPTQLAGRYEMRAPAGQGGMGQVWLAYDRLLRREVAIKQVTVPPKSDAQTLELLCGLALQEAQAAAQISHSHAIRIYDIVQADGLPWIVMEYVPSQTLHQIIRRGGPLDVGYTATIGLAVLGALEAAHRAGVLHRDVTPNNVLIGHDGRIVLADFGLATWASETTDSQAGPMGTAQYVAPERAAEGLSTPAGDLWSLGATLYAAVEGRSPYARPTASETLEALLTQPPDAFVRAGALEPVITGLLQKDPPRRLTVSAARRGLLDVSRLPQTSSQPPAPRPRRRPATVFAPTQRQLALAH